MDSIHYITPEDLNLDIISEIIYRHLKLKLSPESAERIIKCRSYLDSKLENVDRPVYGVTTGFGSLCNKTISTDQLSSLQKNLVMSHACGTGAEVKPEIVKLMLLLKIHALAKGFSGVQLITVERLIDMFNNDVLPVVYEMGSLGASGDLAPLAHLTLPVLGMGEVCFEGKKVASSEVLKRFGWQPVELQSKEGLALLNGTQFMSAHGVYIILRALHLERWASITAAVSLEGYDGRTDPFISQLHDIRPHTGQKTIAARFRKILAGSEIAGINKKHVQDPYSFRCIPQVHGASYDAIMHAANVVFTEVNSVTDNPTVFPDNDLVVSGGNFHGQPLALVFDYLAIALAELGNISERRIYRLISGQRGLPEFLVANPGLNSGFMIPQYVAASIVSQNKQLCSPSSVDSIPSSNEQEDHVSMGANGATRLVRVADNLSRVIAIELFTACQAMEFRRPLKSSDTIERIFSEFRRVVPFVGEDTLMYTEIAKSVDFINNTPSAIF
ncbi:MAG TPA: histidine ammonia-lyase [Bacteroidales bacterium]|nr:histidine ammonia-lyase [Bacteroidales bacterium]HPT12604.1 histidine ammonia-lyase [Bacteroidales bacterium]